MGKFLADFVGQKRSARMSLCVHRKELIDGVNACRVDNKPLRFAVGDAVLANVGKWTPGHVIKEWDSGNPYRIQLDDANLTNVWGPMDNDTYVKANPNGKEIKV